MVKVNATEEEISLLNERTYRVGAQAAATSTLASSIAAAWVVPIAVATVVAAEEQVIAMERERHAVYDSEGVGMLKMQQAKKDEEQDWKTWLADNRFSLVAGAWVCGVAGSLAVNYSNPYLSPTVKAFHARVQSQAITLCALMAAGAVAPFGSKNPHDADVDLFKKRLEFEEKKWAISHNGNMPAPGHHA
ncbi:hypothetical protein SARC_12498 [Sphaeroforma arctica JP610]|uniref:HIG1 domain-containing protein n=1 Tax=Sphaeroforma arctica JP610 TaxID=667725 RepID=A0A0L0FFZ1_9EUKA|nr:hypothetical protein SARC_12498 [Sphaeroforma arctica JP610]KNC74968.1 hypothetical protein SARC_12498 [Sphaeroforma arctica JP610]|eukprot:XP_014148870.1 hypothetical protein SARC_12498 [Sphaeroforma arctica JP610]